MKRLNVAARVLLDPALRRSYDRAPRPAKPPSSDARPSRQRDWFERNELSFDNDWVPPPPAERPYPNSRFAGFFRELRGRDGQLSLQVQEAINSLSPVQQVTFAATLCALAVALIIMARPVTLIGNQEQPTTIDSRSVYP